MTIRIPVVTALLLGLSATAFAGGEVATPPLTPPASGSLVCLVANVGTQEVELSSSMYDNNGTPLGGLNGATVPGRAVVASMSADSGARYCVVTVAKGPKKKIRVTLEARSATGTLVEAVTAP